ncbi:MAG: PhoH family protein, partial [Actinomycetota bacterium]
ALDLVPGRRVGDDLERQELIEVLPLTYIRGRTLTDVFVIIDEAQNLERSVLLTALSRLGPGSRAVLTHDIAQRDNLRVGRRDGIASVIASLRGHELFAHVSLTRSERSAIAALVSDALDLE